MSNLERGNEIDKKINILSSTNTINSKLQQAILIAKGVWVESIGDMESLTGYLDLSLSNTGISLDNLDGLKYATNIGQLYLTDNEISDISELYWLEQLTWLEINKNKIGREYDVLIEKFNGEYYIGRSYEMAPDIDGYIYVKGNGAKKDQFCKVKIEKALEYDLVGVVCNESCK